VEEKKDQAQAEEEKEEQEPVELLDAEDSEAEEQGESTSKDDEALEALEKERDEIYQRLLRVQAEFDNFKKRSQKEKEAERKYKAEDLAKDLLPVLDNFERALQVEETEETKSVIEGIMMVYRELQTALKNNGVEAIEAEGKEFDPNIHHAVMQVEEENEESNVVIEELQKGYMLKDRVIRPAMVKVNK
jgi:molecular chaperone GrpE